MERPQRKRSFLPQSIGGFTPQLPTANNVVSLKQNTSYPNMIFLQELIQNLITLANSLSTSNNNPTSAINTTSTLGNAFTFLLS